MRKAQLFLIILTQLAFGCGTESDRDSQNKPIADSPLIHHNEVDKAALETPDSISSIQKPISQDSLHRLLEKPFDLQDFKNAKRSANSGGGNNKPYYFKPESQGFYLSYFLFPGRTYRDEYGQYHGVMENRRTTLVVYKRKGESYYEDPTELLIELNSKMNDPDLPNLAFVGVDSATIVQRLGSESFHKHGCMVYTHRNKTLILKLENGSVAWVRYSVLDFELLEEQEVPELYEMMDSWY